MARSASHSEYHEGACPSGRAISVLRRASVHPEASASRLLPTVLILLACVADLSCRKREDAGANAPPAQPAAAPQTRPAQNRSAETQPAEEPTSFSEQELLRFIATSRDVTQAARTGGIHVDATPEGF